MHVLFSICRIRSTCVPVGCATRPHPSPSFASPPWWACLRGLPAPTFWLKIRRFNLHVLSILPGDLAMLFRDRSCRAHVVWMLCTPTSFRAVLRAPDAQMCRYMLKCARTMPPRGMSGGRYLDSIEFDVQYSNLAIGSV